MSFLTGMVTMWLLICSFMVSSYVRRVRQGVVRFEWSTFAIMATGGAIGLMVMALHSITEETR